MKDSIKKDIESFVEKFPKFSIAKIDAENVIKLEGVVDIVDVTGVYWDSYDIYILLPIKNYPYSIPKVYEVSAKICREDDWHISIDGECCLDITHKLILLQNKGINLLKFYQQKIYSFFANHAYKLKTGTYANGDYPHQFDGILYFYHNELHITDHELIIKLLTLLSINKNPNKYARCI
ncbi:MAG: hypothetical protein EOO43_15705, partial [Flavobacterium sp.]